MKIRDAWRMVLCQTVQICYKSARSTMFDGIRRLHGGKNSEFLKFYFVAACKLKHAALRRRFHRIADAGWKSSF